MVYTLSDLDQQKKPDLSVRLSLNHDHSTAGFSQ